MADKEQSLVPALSRAVAILDLVAAEGVPLGISAIARHLSLPKSSVANICATLVDTGMMRLQNGGVQLGLHLAQLGGSYLSSIDQVSLFQDSCDLLEMGRKETVQLAVLGDGVDVIYLAKREGVHPVRLASTPGRALPATCTATGKAMLATLGDDDVRIRLSGAAPFPRLTSNSITNEEALFRELALIRSRGYALDREEVIEGVVCVGVAIPRDARNDRLLAVSITLLKPSANQRHLRCLARELHVVARHISLGLGTPASHALIAEQRRTTRAQHA